MDKSRLDLAVYRLEKSAECIKTAKSDLENGFYSASVNRSYYAIFHSARAVMALDGEDRKRHTGVISYFQEHYIKTKIFDIELSDIIQDAFNMRQNNGSTHFIMGAVFVCKRRNEIYNDILPLITIKKSHRNVGFRFLCDFWLGADTLIGLTEKPYKIKFFWQSTNSINYNFIKLLIFFSFSDIIKVG